MVLTSANAGSVCTNKGSEKGDVKELEVMNVVGGKPCRVRQMVFQRSLLGLPNNIGQRVCCQLWMLMSEVDKARVAATEHVEFNDEPKGIVHPPTHMEIANAQREPGNRHSGISVFAKPADSKT